jgi:aryl-alcohol dehydrogenase-like predicted oxidoreductase
MEYTRLGRTGLRVSRLCLGTMNFGPETDEPTSHRIMDHAHELGINFFDTANMYGERLGEGVTEQILGRWFATGGARRDNTVLATKVYCPMGTGPNQSRLSALHIMRACEASLRRLQTDRIDLYQLHHIDRDAPWDETWQAMETLVLQGKVLYVGSSNFAGWHIAQANEAARRRHFLGLVSEQSLYNLMDRMIELEVIPACQSYGVGLIPYSPLNGGVLGGAVAKARQGRRANQDAQKLLARHHAQLASYETLCAEHGLAPGDVALAWLLAQPAVTAPIVGPRDIAQLQQAEAARGLELGRELLQRLDAIFPGPGGAAPEAYAW